jgi:hypothetical protein
MGAPQTPPGWYRDPVIPGGARWWDGTQWTDHAQPLSPPTPGDAATGQTSTSWWVRRRVLIPATAIVLAVALGLAVRGGDEPRLVATAIEPGAQGSDRAPEALAGLSIPTTTASTATESTASGCHPAYTPCLPNRPGDALDCGDLDASLRPVRLVDVDQDPYRLDGEDRDGVGCGP